MEGILMMWTNFIYGWKKKYFCIKSNTLVYATDKLHGEKSCISLDSAQISTHTNPKRFMIVIPGSTLHLKALSTEEASKWIKWLNTSKSSNSKDTSTIEDVVIEEESNGCKVLFTKISKLWTLQEQLELYYSQLIVKFKEAPEPMQLILANTSEFKMLALDTVNLIEAQGNCLKERMQMSEEIEPITRSARETIDEFCMNRLSELSDSGKESIFIDARSNFSEDSFHDVKSHFSYSQNLIHRKSLPMLRNPNIKCKLWKDIKNYIKNDLGSVPVPISYYEPLSILQRLSEDMTYSDILIRAAEEENPLLRLALVACFSISCYTSTFNRKMKPFTPLLGETFDLEKDGFSYISEQVSSNPSTSAWHCSHAKYTYSGSTKIQSKFKGTYLKISPKGQVQVTLIPFHEKYVWKKLPVNAHNIIVGNVYLDHYGEYECICLSTGAKALINFKKKTWFAPKKHYVEGSVVDVSGKIRYKILGKWSEKVVIKSQTTGNEFIGYELLPYPTGFEENYWFTEFAMQLNVPPEFAPGICGSDSRFRPDIRALENGDIESASRSLEALEKKMKKDQGRRARWFEGEEDDWVFAQNYWACKAQAMFDGESSFFECEN